MARKQKVLVVDDDRVIGQSFDRVLSEKGYRVSTALNGEEALKKMDTNGFDLVFTDIKMPGMDGLEVAKRIKEMNPWIPVVVVTGYGTEANEARAEEVGVSGFLRKPLSPDVIEWITQKTISESHAAPSIAAAVAPKAAVEPRPRAEAQPAAEGKENIAKNIALFFAAPFIGLAYIIAFPFVGFAMLAKWGLRSLMSRGHSG